MTNYHSYGYHLLLERERGDAVGTVYKYLKDRSRRWDLLQLQELSTHIKSHEELLEEAKSIGFKSETWVRGDSAFVPITSVWVEYYNSLKSKFRSNLRNRTKRLVKEGAIAYEVIEGLTNIDSALVRGFEIEKKGWKGSSNTAIACNPVLTSFYTEIANVAAQEKWLRLSFLKVGDSYVAFDYSLVYNNTLYCLKIGYDPVYKRYSVGQL